VFRVTETEAFAGELGIRTQPSAKKSLRRIVRSRHRDRDFALRRALLAADMAGLCLALAFALLVAGNRDAPLADLLWMLPTLPLWAFLFWAYELYGRSIRRFEPAHLDDASSLFHALVLGTLGLWLYYKAVASAPQLSFEEVAIFGLFSLPTITGLRAVLRARNLRAQGPERVFAIAPLEDVALLQRKLDNHPEYEMGVVGTVGREATEELELPLWADLDRIEELMASKQIDHVIARLDANYLPQEQMRTLMRACHREGVRFSCFPAVMGLLPPGIEINHLEGVGLLTSNPPVLPRSARIVKRGLDVVISALALTLLAPLMALMALAVKLTSKGPVFYRQIRVGKDGRTFELFKFRTMVLGADRLDDELMESSIDPHWLVMEEDPRVTGVGRVLRRNSLDELPQLWNVLKGDMSMVGPRPLSERDDLNVRGWRRHRLDLVPGITGYWQVLGRNSIPFEEMLEVDYAYVTSWSLWHDVRLLLQTVPAVLHRRGAN
jgi:exopolysaccharide biosynthesis polyprenyl glycosylphosphotransferase